MTARQVTVLVAGILAAGLFVLAWLLPVPYVILSPGPFQDTLGHLPGTSAPLITIRGRTTHPSRGHLFLLTVLLSGGPGQQPTLLTALRAWANHEDAVIPQEFEFPPGQSTHQVLQQNLLQMQQSQQDAITAALAALNLPGPVEVQSVTPGTPAAKALRPGDVIESVDGRPVHRVDTLLRDIRAVRAGTRVRLVLQRGHHRVATTVGTISAGGATIVGFVPIELPAPPLSISIDLKDVGGPSAGMMFALGIIDKLSSGGLSAGRSIAGTGTIDFAGNVGPIGGIQQKVFAALAAGATVFLAPAAECAAAQRVAPARLRIIPVRTLAGAVSALHALAARRPVPRC